MALKKANQSGNGNDVEKVISQIENEGMRTLNSAIETDEDGIVRDVPLLAGYIDDNGVLHSTFSYREMTGKDEEAISKGDVRSNGAKLVNVLCERCVVSIGTLTKKECGANWGKIIRSMLGGDIDYMAFKIRELSKGSEVTFTHKCPSCGSKLNTIIQTDEFGIKPFMGQREIDFSLVRGYVDGKKIAHKDGVLRLANGFDREVVTPLFKKNASTAMTMLLTRLMSLNDGTPVVNNYVNEMSIRDRDILEGIIKDNAFGLDTSLDIVCVNCGQDLSGEMGQSDFF